MASITETGLKLDDIQDVRLKLQNKAIEVFQPLSGSSNLSVDDSGVLGRILGIFSEPLASQEEVIQIIASSIDPNQATGLALDNILNLRGLERFGERYASGFLIVLGNNGASLPDTCSVRSSKTGNVFNFTEDVTFDNLSCNGVEIDVDEESTQPFIITYSIESRLSSSPPVTIYPIINETKKQLVDRIVTVVNSQSSYIEASSDNEVLIIKILNSSDIGSFTVSSNMEIPRVYALTTIVAAESNTIWNDEKTINQVASGATIDWKSSYNPYGINKSLSIESDAEVRFRLKSYNGYNNLGSKNSLYAVLTSLKGVSFVNIRENTLPNPATDGRINKGLAIIVQGGDEDDIANAIFSTIGVGTLTDGTVSVNVEDINGQDNEIKFSRPEIVNIKIDLRLLTYPTFPTNGVAQIKQKIVEYFNNLQVGEDVYYSRIFTPINEVEGFSVNSMKISKVGFPLDTDNITINYNQIAVISYNDITTG